MILISVNLCEFCVSVLKKINTETQRTQSFTELSQKIYFCTSKKIHYEFIRTRNY